jgi:hypothetical protein
MQKHGESYNLINYSYLFTDNLHSWVTDPFIPKNGRISLQVPTQQGTNVQVVLYPKVIENFEKQSGKRIINATIYKIEGFEIIS